MNNFFYTLQGYLDKDTDADPIIFSVKITILNGSSCTISLKNTKSGEKLFWEEFDEKYPNNNLNEEVSWLLEDAFTVYEKTKAPLLDSNEFNG